MRSLPQCIASLAFALALGACASGSEVSLTPVPVDFKVIDHENSRIQDAQEVVLRDHAAYAALWSKHRSFAPLPPINFNSTMVAAVFIGQVPSGCHSVTVTRVLQVPGRTTIEYQKNKPGGRDLCSAAIYYPAVWIAIPVTPGDVFFVRKTE